MANSFLADASLDGGDNGYQYGLANECPNLREITYGSTIKSRSLFQTNFVNLSAIGPPDLIHWGNNIGISSAQYSKDDFHYEKQPPNKDDDGFIGHYHYVNGLYHDSYLSIEKYIMNVIGIVKADTGDYYWSDTINPTIVNYNTSYGLTSSKKEIIVTFCTYNMFSKCDLRIKYVISPKSNSKKSPLLFDKSFQILPNDPNGKKVSGSIYKLNEFPHIWQDLNVSSIIRLFVQTDDGSKQLPGLVSYPQMVEDKLSIRMMIESLVKYLHKGHLTDSSSSFGSVTGCQSSSSNVVKTNVYRNHLIDVLLRLNHLDLNGESINYTINLINNLPNSQDWQFVILKLLKNSKGANNSPRFLNLIHQFFKKNETFTTQSCLILLEQIKFLLSKEEHKTALKLSQLTIKIMPLDFECWFYLSLCYALNGDYQQALLSINSIPMTLNKNIEDFDLVNGITDEFTNSFIKNLRENREPITEKTFLKYFPVPKEYINRSLVSDHGGEVHKPTGKVQGQIKHLWNDIFIFNPNVRFPKSGNQFYQTPLICKTAKDLSTVDGSLIKLTGPNSLKLKLSGYSANNVSSSILDFGRKSPWGRCYDVLSYIIAKIGWDEMMRVKTLVFNDKLNILSSAEAVNFTVDNTNKKSSIKCQQWLDQMFVLIYEDLRTLMLITAPDRSQNHSILEWEMLGLLGWNVKYNLKVTMSSIITSCLGNMNNPENYESNYFSSVQLLMIYDEFVLSDIDNSQIDIFGDDYSKAIFTNKLILKENQKLYDNFTKSIVNDYLTLDLVLLLLINVSSWNLRWYQYLPNHLITKVLIKLCILNAPEYLIGKIKILFDTNKSEVQEGYKFLRFNKVKDLKKFDPNDTIVEYMTKMIKWVGRSDSDT